MTCVPDDYVISSASMLCAGRHIPGRHALHCDNAHLSIHLCLLPLHIYGTKVVSRQWVVM